ncbi:hypothetical protein [Stratiformator vulcanicus]|uniref:Uncharacterized protein n=1 Tax=Stratiformator vulcanicus TaxID=2527980 RepID=A0A517R7L2_9PLAN|nr:hypothetical protein [Stratiformator vulcanicus]QDT39852.1 hypothetical protein Pan189_42640 [Stratiformator vulcanicus]
MHRILIPASLVVGALIAGTVTEAVAQTFQYRGGTRPRTIDRSDAGLTTLSIEIISAEGIGLDAQRWSQRFERFGYAVRIRRGLPGEGISVTEKKRGPLRTVKVIGAIDDRGRLLFPSQTFEPTDVAELQEWLDELKSFGAQGTPDGKAMWGLNKTQFDKFYAAVSEKAAADVTGLKLPEAIRKLGLPSVYQLKFSAAAMESMKQTDHRFVKHSPRDLSVGTTLAAVLNEFGLGFRPLRTPEGGIKLMVESIDEGEDLWPVGWTLNGEGADRAAFAPALFSVVAVDFRQAKLADVLRAVEAQTDIPILIDHDGLSKAGIDPAELTVKVRPRKTSWSIVLRDVTLPHFLDRELRRDEEGRALLWIKSSRPPRDAEDE